MSKAGVPEASYGVLTRERIDSDLDEVAEQIVRLGYGILDSGYSEQTLRDISTEFDSTRTRYLEKHGRDRLKSVNELHTIRSPLTYGGPVFLRLAFNQILMALLKKLISGKFILNQQNGVINPPGETYNQGAWHRDLPYQHFVSTTPLALNALFCVDDFTSENGSTFVLPASHKMGAFPSKNYIERNATQILAKAGQFIVLDCMLFHSGGFNRSAKERRAINHMYNIPYFKQQINIPMNIQGESLSAEEREILGFGSMEPDSIQSYLDSRGNKKY